jgi:lysozyme family protein
VVIDIDRVLREVLEREGWPTYAVHPNDRGGPTKGGITLRTLESWRGRRCTRAELKRLDEAEALAILGRRYAEAQGIQRLEEPELQAQVIDNAVLSGPVLAAKDLQRAVGVVADGIIGPKTLAAIQHTGSVAAGARLAIERSLRLARHVAANPDQLVFLVGWLTRALQFIKPPKTPINTG